MTKRKRLRELFKNMQDYEIVQIWNDYCGYNNYYDDYIYNMSQFDELMENESSSDIANKIFYGDFNPNNEYFLFNGYGNLISIAYFDILEYISINDLIDYIIENDENFNNDEIDEILQDDEIDE